MIKKRGLTVAMLMITVIILGILAGTITFSVNSTIKRANLSAWINEITNIQDVVNEELNNKSALDYSLGNITLNISDIPQSIVNEQFEGEVIEQDEIELKILDLGKFGITDTKYGNLTKENDVYAMSDKTGKVYYVAGIEVDGYTYYLAANSLKNRFDLGTPENTLTSVVFMPSVIGYTNLPITVTIKVPNSYTNIAISTSNTSIAIGEQVVRENIYEYLVNTNNITGNYTITVSYNDGVKTLTSIYEVNGYDITAPVINPVVYDNLYYRETDTQVLDYLTNVTASDAGGIKEIKYSIGTITENQAKEYFSQSGTQVAGGKINLDRTTTIYTIYAEDNAGNFSVLTFDKKYVMPEEWKESVSYIQDRVPIPKGFVASPYEDEDNKKEGLVIYELNENETTISSSETQFESWTTRNQFVWVPVNDFSTFVRKDYITSKVTDAEGKYYSLGAVDFYWEVIVNSNNIPLQEQVETYMSETTLAEVQAMYASVKEYKGFYIGRYEAGIDSKRESKTEPLVNGKNVYSRMGKIPYTYINWSTMDTMSNDMGGAVEVARGMYQKNSPENPIGAVSTLAYGVQWDAVLQWYTDSRRVTSYNISRDSTSFGNYVNNIINSPDELNTDALVWDYTSDNKGAYVEKNSSTLKYPKTASSAWCLSTGALKTASVNNIYDMAGNVYEWTMEGVSSNYRVYRGGYFTLGGNQAPIAYRTSGNTTNGFSYMCGFRHALYIKK